MTSTTISIEGLMKYAGYLAAVAGWIWAVIERVQKSRAERTLEEMKRHAHFPILQLLRGPVSKLWDTDERGEPAQFLFAHGNILSVQNQEMAIDSPAGCPVFLVLDDLDNPAIFTSVKLDGESLVKAQEPDLHNSDLRHYLKYPFDPARHGQRQEIKIVFKARNGAEDTHTYETIHGKWFLKRVDPRLG